VADLKMIFKVFDPDMSDDEVEQIFSEVDEDGSGTVDYEGMSSIFLILSLIFKHFFFFL
jgi:Ca2+-binding EF-hand superfamily protein